MARVDSEVRLMREYAAKHTHALGLEGPRGERVVFEPRSFTGNRGIRVVFRKLGQGDENEHYLNHLACALTREIGDQPPFGNNCHCEIVMDMAPVASRSSHALDSTVTVRIGTMLKHGEKHADGTITWKPGSMFIKQISEGDLEKYEAFALPATRDMELRMLCFALMNLGAPFNEYGYNTRAFWYKGLGSVGSYDPEANHVRHGKPLEKVSFFCPQLCVLLLQAAAHESVRALGRPHYGDGWVPRVQAMDAATPTPNSLYRACTEWGDARQAGRVDARLRLN